ncbi:MAG: hypothetical protein AAFW70_16350 [Cyanobacteria bacterium J06635_10]
MNSRLIQYLGMGLAVLGLGLLSASCSNSTTSATKGDESPENSPLVKQGFDGVTLVMSFKLITKVSGFTQLSHDSAWCRTLIVSLFRLTISECTSTLQGKCASCVSPK